MLKYNGRLLPYRPVIAAMLLAGQSYRQVADLLWAMGARSEFTDPLSGPYDKGRESTQGLVRVMDLRWSGKRLKSGKWVDRISPDADRISPDAGRISPTPIFVSPISPDALSAWELIHD
jgi:hypothetical protein